jgi:signal peptidase
VARKGAPAVSDVIAYRPEGWGDAKVVHQIVGGDGVTGWDVKGVNNDWLDQWHPTNDDVAGVVVFSLGAGNRIGTVILSPLFWGAFLLVAVGLLLLPESQDDPAVSDRAAPEPAPAPEPPPESEPEPEPAPEPALAPARTRPNSGARAVRAE